MPVRAGGCFSNIFRLTRTIARIHTRMKGEPPRKYNVRGYDGKAFLEALALFATLPALKDLVLRFREHDGPFKSDPGDDAQNRDCFPDVVLQHLIFRALGEIDEGFPAHLRSLTIDKFLPLPHSFLESEPITSHLSTLTHFAINTTSHCAAFPDHNPRSERSSNHRIFPTAALSSSLVSLQLHNACLRSADKLFPISEVHLPRLAYLSLQRTYFSKEREVENFIARHGATLVELKLFMCPMAISTSSRRGTADEDFYRWGRVWENLNSELRVLKNLVVSAQHDSDGVEDVELGRYIDSCYHCGVVKMKVRITRADDKVLERFQKSVESRSQ